MKVRAKSYTVTIMSQAANTILENSWNSLADLSVLCHESLDNRDFDSLVTHWRKMYWAASFLGLENMVNILVGGMELVPKMLKNSSPQLEKVSRIMLGRLEKIRKEVETKIPQIASNGKVCQQLSEFRSSVQIADIDKIFRHYHIDSNRVSAYRHLAIGRDEVSNVKISIPSFAKKQHNPNRTLVLIYLNICIQNQELPEISATLDKAFKESELFLHGTLSLPLTANEDKKFRYPYYLLLDIPQSGEKWLDSVSLNGRVITVLQEALVDKTEKVVTGGKTAVSNKKVQTDSTFKTNGSGIMEDPGRIIKTDEIVNNQFSEINRQRLSRLEFPQYKETENKLAVDTISFDATGVSDVVSLEKQAKSKKKHQKIHNKDLHIRFPVGMKLILIVTTIILISMLSLSFIGLYFFRQEITNRIDDTNISLSKLVARQAENELNNIFDSANILFQLGAAAGRDQDVVDNFFANSGALVYVGVPNLGVGFFNKAWFNENRIFDSAAILESILASRGSDLEKANTGETVILNVSPLIPNLETPILALAAPITVGTTQNSLMIIADIGNSLAESVRLQEGFTTTVIINSMGDVLAHPDFAQVFGGANLKESPVFMEMYGPGNTAGQIKYAEKSPDGLVSFLASYMLIPIGQLGVVTTVSEENAFKAVERVQYLNLTLLGGILSLAILGVFLFSQRLSTPLKELALATRKIKAKNYAVDIKSYSRDEVGQLTQHFLSMIPELEKVDRFQERVRSFINPQVARMIADNTLPEYAETKEITVYFSDVRNFTAISESIGDPQIVLDNLSDYFRTVVPCIEQSQGTVDKFIGDAVMAVWGTVKELQNTAINAIDAALQIRRILLEFNSERGNLTNPIFHIGMGINTGPASIGIIGGGSAKEEWGCIGDTINLASRIESLNKPMGTDILITQFTADKVKGIYDIVPMNKIKVKGKTEPLQIYAVLGRLDDDFRPFTLEELRSMLGISCDFQYFDSVKNEEAKYELINS